LDVDGTSNDFPLKKAHDDIKPMVASSIMTFKVLCEVMLTRRGARFQQFRDDPVSRRGPWKQEPRAEARTSFYESR